MTHFLTRHSKGASPILTSIPNVEMAARQAQPSHETEPEHGLFRAIMDQSPVGIAVLDGKELRALCANPTYLELLEEPYRSRGITGRLFVEFVPH